MLAVYPLFSVPPTLTSFFSEGIGLVFKKRECLSGPVLVSVIHSTDLHLLNALYVPGSGLDVVGDTEKCKAWSLPSKSLQPRREQHKGTAQTKEHCGPPWKERT